MKNRIYLLLSLFIISNDIYPAYLSRIRAACGKIRITTCRFTTQLKQAASCRFSFKATPQLFEQKKPIFDQTKYYFRKFTNICIGVGLWCFSKIGLRQSYIQCMNVDIKQQTGHLLNMHLDRYHLLSRNIKNLKEKLIIEEFYESYHEALIQDIKCILDYVVDHYEEAKHKLCWKSDLDLNELLDQLSAQERQIFYDKVVRKAWFWDFQRKTYHCLFKYNLLKDPLKKEYAMMLCKTACELKQEALFFKNFSNDAFQERIACLKKYAYETEGQEWGESFLNATWSYFKTNGALGQK